MELKKSISIFLIISLSYLSSSSATANDPAAGPAPSIILSHEPTSTDPNTAKPLVKTMCSKTDHPQDCFNVLVPLTKDKGNDPISVLEVSVGATTNLVKEGMAATQKLLPNKALMASHPQYKKVLETCIETYNSITESNNKILDAIKANDVYLMRSELSSSIDNIDTCENAFAEEGIEDSPLAHINDLLGKMVNNNLAMGVDSVEF